MTIWLATITFGTCVMTLTGFIGRASAQEVAGVRSPDVGVKAIGREEYRPAAGTFGGRIVRDTLGEPKSFNPITAGETSTTAYTARIFQGLTDTDPFTGEAIPLLAERWNVADDGLTWTFHLRRDVKFNDGTPLTAADVVFTWNDLIYDLSRPEGSPARWPCSTRDIATFDGKIVQVSALDDYTVQFVTPVKNAIWDLSVAEGILSRSKYKPLVDAGTFGGAMAADAEPADLVGTGPFMLGRYDRGERVVLHRNPNYWKEDVDGKALPYLDELVFLIVRDLNTMLLNFEQNITDVYAVPSGKEVARLKPRQRDLDFTLYQFGPDDGTLFMALNMNSDAAAAGRVPEYKVNWFRDKRFRQALSMAIDRGAQVRNVRRNLGYVQSAPFTLSAGPFLQKGIAPPVYDVDTAKAMLKEMGFTPGSDGFLRDPEGREVSFTINTNSGNTIREETADFIRKDLEQIGIRVNTLYLEFNLLVDKMDSSFDWEAIVMGLTGGREPHFGANVWLSTGRLHMWWPEQKTPSFDWERRIDEIFFDGIQEMDKQERKALYREWVEIVAEQQPFIYLTVAERVAGVRNRFGNLFATPVGELFFNEDEIFILPGK